MRDLQTGITYINAGTTGAEVHLPFGGMKQTGNGHREAGQAALDVFTEWKSIYVDYSGKLQRAQIDNVVVSRKLVVFVPPEALDAVRDAVFAAGAGRIGEYERCSWYTEGTGTFLGGEATTPAVGEAGRRSASPSCGSRRCSRRAPRRRRRRAARRAPVRGAGVRRLRAAREGAAVHRRRRARQPGPGRVRLRARGRGRDGARAARRGDRGRDEQRRRVQRPRRRAAQGGRAARAGRSRSSPTRSCW